MASDDLTLASDGIPCHVASQLVSRFVQSTTSNRYQRPTRTTFVSYLTDVGDWWKLAAWRRGSVVGSLVVSDSAVRPCPPEGGGRNASGGLNTDKLSTIVLRASTSLVLANLERAIDDGVRVVNISMESWRPELAPQEWK